jgi:hypothetical protein
MAKAVTEPAMREKLLSLATEWLDMAREFEREAIEHEETLQVLRWYLGVKQVAATRH